jgi:monoamine oxidase
MTFMNWTQRAWQKGSRSYFAPGQFSRLSGIAQEADYAGRFLFAGEHTSVDFPGTLEGAFATGIAAAEAVRRARG